MQKFLVPIIVVIIALVGYFVLYKGPSKATSLRFAPTTAPANPNITQAQKFLFENRLRSSSGEAEAQKLVSTAAATSKTADTVAVGNSCRPDVPVLRMYPDKAVIFKNTASVSQELVFGKARFMLKPSSEISLSLSDIFPGYVSPKGVTSRSYTCTGMRSAAGFIVTFPD